MFATAGPVKVAGRFGATPPILGALSHPVSQDARSGGMARAFANSLLALAEHLQNSSMPKQAHKCHSQMPQEVESCLLLASA